VGRAEDGAIADLALLAVTLGLPVADLAPDDRAAHAVAWLTRCEQRWLLVLDNVNDPATLDACCPAGGNGRVLITSRNRDLAEHGPVLSVDVFDDDTAADYLIARTGRTDERAGALALARALRGLPLALAHAGAYCAKTTSFDAYLQLLTDLPPRALYDRSPEAFYRQTVASTWQPSITAAETETPLARALLMMAAHLAADAIPIALFDALLNNADDAWQRKRLLDAVTALDRYSLVDVHDATLDMHRLLQRVVLDADSDGDRELLGLAGRAALRALGAATPPDPALPQWWPGYEQLLAHVLALGDSLTQPEDAQALIALLNHMCVYLLHLGASERTVSASMAAGGHAERLLGSEHRDTLTARANLATSYSQAGRTNDAITLLEAVLADSERLLGPEHPDTLTARANLATSYSQAGRTNDAITLLEAVLADSERLLGPEHPNTLTARANLDFMAGSGDVAE
jgi:tetratricopeptide (TPR) repeat protein